MGSILFLIALGSALFPLISAETGYKLTGSSGSSAQMVFVPPYTDTAVFIDNYHENYGGPGYDFTTGKHSDTPYVYEGTTEAVFGTEYNLTSNTIRPLQPQSNIFCSAGAFFPNGTLVNLAGAEAVRNDVLQGFDKLRTYEPGPCNGACDMDWKEVGDIQVYRWYPNTLTMVDGSVLAVGGSNAGGLALNEASINVPTYEIVHVDGRAPKPPVTLPILEFTEEENLIPGKSWNLYPILHALPNPEAKDHIFTIAGNQTIIWDYAADTLIKTLPDTPRQARTFPSAATSVLLPLSYPDYTPTVLVCGGSSDDIPDPKGLDDCWTINPSDETPVWNEDDRLPNGPQTMTDGILLPDGKVLFINGVRRGYGGGFNGEDPVFVPLIYDPAALAGSRFTSMPETTVPRMYHSTAVLLPSGEVIIAGSNPGVWYSRSGQVDNSSYPFYKNNGHICALHTQQARESAYPTEYRVEKFSPPYLDAADKPVITSLPDKLAYNSTFEIEAQLKGAKVEGEVQINLVAQGFHTHAVGMGQKLVRMGFKAKEEGNGFEVYAPRDASVIAPGVFLMFVVSDGVPSEGKWVAIG